MNLLASIFGGPLIKTFIDALIGPALKLFEAYFNKQISIEQLKEKLAEAALEAFASVEQAFLQSLTQTYTAFITAAKDNKTLARMMAITLYSQLAVLMWHQFGIPFVIFIGLTKSYPSSGATVDWAYALIALCLGAPAIASRVGPAAGWAADNLKRLTGR